MFLTSFLQSCLQITAFISYKVVFYAFDQTVKSTLTFHLIVFLYYPIRLRDELTDAVLVLDTLLLLAMTLFFLLRH